MKIKFKKQHYLLTEPIFISTGGKLTEDAVKSILSGNIRHLRLMKDLSQQELAEKTNISVPFLSALERGEKFPR